MQTHPPETSPSSPTVLKLEPCPSPDATSWIRDALDQCRRQKIKRLVLPTGTYQFHRDLAREAHLFISNNDSGLKRIAFYLDRFDDFEIDGQGSLFVFHGQILPFVIEDSHRITLRNLRVDWHRSFHSETLITRVTEDALELEIPDAYPYYIERGRLVFEVVKNEQIAHGTMPRTYAINNILEFDAQRRETAYKACDHWGLNLNHQATELSPGRIRFQAPLLGPRPKVGNILALIDGGRECPAITVSNSGPVLFENIALHHASGMGIIAQSSHDITLRKVMVKPGPESKRMISLQADATHFVNCRGHILMEDCEFSHQLDDATNIHGVFTPVSRRISDRSVIVHLHHFQQRGVRYYEKGHPVELIKSSNLSPRGQNEIAGVNYLNSEYALLEFRDPLPTDFGPGFAIGSLYWVADATIRRTHLHSNRARGYLVTTGGKWLIEENHFHTAGCAILIESDASHWHEAGAVKDVLIRNNLFDNCNYGPWGRATIDIDPKIPDAEQTGQRFHHNIRIENNEFRTFHRDILKAHCTEGLTFKNNTIRFTKEYPAPDNSGEMFEFTHCSKIEVADNTVVP